MNKRLKETMEKQQKAISKRVGPGKSLDVKGLIKVLNFFFFILYRSRDEFHLQKFAAASILVIYVNLYLKSHDQGHIDMRY